MVVVMFSMGSALMDEEMVKLLFEKASVLTSQLADTVEEAICEKRGRDLHRIKVQCNLLTPMHGSWRKI